MLSTTPCEFYLVLGGGCVLPSPSLISSIILGSRTFRHTMFSRTAFTLQQHSRSRWMIRHRTKRGELKGKVD
jgi:hypothetical protein